MNPLLKEVLFVPENVELKMAKVYNFPKEEVNPFELKERSQLARKNRFKKK